MPLAIELATARLRSVSLTHLHDMLDQRFRILTGGSRSALARQQTLRATVEWSYSLLNGAEKILLHRLSVFAETFDLEAVKVVCADGATEELDITDLLSSLVDKSMVVAERTGSSLRYRLLETIRQFAAERLTQIDEREAAVTAAAHWMYFLSVAEVAGAHLSGSDQGRWLARLDEDQPNLRRAMERAAGQGDQTVLILRFAMALRRYWLVRARHDDVLRILMPVLDRPETHREPRLRVVALATAAGAIRSIDIQAALRLGATAVDVARQIHDERLLAHSLRVLCGVYYFAGDPDGAFQMGKEAAQLARSLDDDVLLSECLRTFLLCSYDVDPSSTDVLFDEAMASVARSGDLYVMAALLHNAATHDMLEGNTVRARRRLEQAAQGFQAIGKPDWQLKAGLGFARLLEGDFRGARTTYQEGFRLSRRNGDRFWLAYTSLGLACVSAEQTDWHRAAQLHGVADAFRDQTGQPWLSWFGPYQQVSIDNIRSQLDDGEFERFYASGRALSFDDAVHLALHAVDSA
jgi:hypothetical protein